MKYLQISMMKYVSHVIIGVIENIEFAILLEPISKFVLYLTIRLTQYCKLNFILNKRKS